MREQIQPVTFIAGPCSIDDNNRGQIDSIAAICLPNGKPAIRGSRVVGGKSRTVFGAIETMGIDAPAIDRALDRITDNKLPNPDDIGPSVLYAEEIVRDHAMLVATEIMHPLVQLPWYAGRIPDGKFLAWNPSVEQLGWTVRATGKFARKHGWYVGLKNGKALGTKLADCENPERTIPTPMETAWAGLATYAEVPARTMLIHRGVDVPEKGDYRNAPVHQAARRAKEATGMKLYFDPSHSLGPTLRDHIADSTVQAMQMRHGNGFLYDGILIEAGTATTDTKQHITVAELSDLVRDVAKIREIRTRPKTAKRIYKGGSLV